MLVKRTDVWYYVDMNAHVPIFDFNNDHIYAAIDLKSFYASVECVDRKLDPLKTNLVVADESRTDKTICLAVSPSLKAYGIPGRCRLFEVKQTVGHINATRLKSAPGGEFSGSSADDDALKSDPSLKLDFIIAKPHMLRYMECSTNIYMVYLKYFAPEDIHVYSCDEVFIDITRYMEIYKLSPEELIRKVILEVYKLTQVTATAGIGSNLYLCKIAMDIVAKRAQPDENGVRMAYLDEMGYRKILWGHKPITDFWRIGRGIATRLATMGIYTMGDLARASINGSDQLYKMMGIDAEILIDHAWGYEPCGIEDIKKYEPETTSLTSGQVLMEPYDNDKARLIVKEMTESLVLEMVEKCLVTDSFTLTIGYDRCNVDAGGFTGEINRDYYGRRVPKSAHGSFRLTCPTSSTRKVMAGMVRLFDEITDKKLMIRRITLVANNLGKENYGQLSLFSNREADEKERKMQEAEIYLKHKFGKNAVLKGMNLSEGGTAIMRNNQIGGHKA